MILRSNNTQRQVLRLRFVGGCESCENDVGKRNDHGRVPKIVYALFRTPPTLHTRLSNVMSPVPVRLK